MSITVTVTGAAELSARFSALAAGLSGEILGTAVAAGALPILNAAKSNAPKRSGNLARSIHASAPAISGDSAVVTVGTDLVYARIQEYGGTIYPKRGKYLVFEMDGKMIFAKKVTLKPHPYMRPALDQNKETARAEMERVIVGFLKAA